MNCPYCSNPVPPGVNNCPSCGAAVSQPQQAAPAQPFPQNMQRPIPSVQKSVGTAQILACLIPGLGQIYNGQVVKGIVIILANIILASATFGISGIVILILAVIDAGNIAKKLNEGRTVGEWEFF